MDSDLREFTQYVSWRGGGDLEFLLYAMRPRDSIELRPPDLSRWPPGTICKHYLLQDDPWPFVIDLFEIHAPYLPKRYEPLLCTALSALLGQGALVSWFMFEGTFGDVTHLFLPEQAEGTYGIAWSGQIPTLAVRGIHRRDPEWPKLLNEAANVVHSRYPNMRTMYTNDG